MQLKQHFTKASKHHEKMSNIHSEIAAAHDAAGAKELVKHHRALARAHSAHADHLSEMAETCDGDGTHAKGVLSASDKAFIRKLVELE